MSKLSAERQTAGYAINEYQPVGPCSPPLPFKTILPTSIRQSLSVLGGGAGEGRIGMLLQILPHPARKLTALTD